MKLSFHGGIRGVTGSCYLIETSKSKILVDCGMFQGERIVGGFNFEDFGFNPQEIDTVIVTHAHYDHNGRIPILIKKGFQGAVFSTPPTKSLMKIVLEDAQRVMVENAQKYGDPILFSQGDVSEMMQLCKGINYHTEFEPARGMSAMFHDAGHILGSSFVTIEIPESETKSGEPIKLLFSGDLGNDDVPILPPTECIESADIVVCESTYGDRDHENTKERTGKLKKEVKKVLGRKGTLVIPAFSIERTQELLYELDQLKDAKEIPNAPIYLDSPLAINATEIYRHFAVYLRFDRPVLESPDHDFFSFKNLKETLSVDDSKVINNDNRPKIIIAGSGMMTGGRVQHHLMRYLPDEKSEVLIIGYQAVGTLGRKIEDGAKEVNIFHKKIEVNAEIEKIASFSAHADRNKMRQWLVPKTGKVKKVFLTHGDLESKESFKEFLEQKLDSEIIIPKFHEEFEF